MGALLTACIVDLPALECTNATHCGTGQQCVAGRCIDRVLDVGGDTDVATDTDVVTDAGRDNGEDDGDVAPEVDEADLSGSLDPAPDRQLPGSYPCEGGPAVDTPGLFHTITRTGAGDYLAVSGTVTDAIGSGTWYARFPDGREQVGAIVSSQLDGSFQAVVPTGCGIEPTRVKLLWEGAACDHVEVLEIATTFCVDGDLRVSLIPNPAAAGLSLHLVRPGGELNDSEDDCDSESCGGPFPDWGEIGENADDPLKVTRQSPPGFESIRLDQPEEGVFEVFVERFDDDVEEPVDATLIVSLRRDQAVETTASQVLALPARNVWEGAAVDWASGQVTPSSAVRDCSEAWSEQGCLDRE